MTIWSLSAYSLMAYEVRKFLQVQTLFFRYPTSERVDMVRLWMQEFRSLESREATPLHFHRLHSLQEECAVD